MLMRLVLFFMRQTLAGVVSIHALSSMILEANATTLSQVPQIWALLCQFVRSMLLR